MLTDPTAVAASPAALARTVTLDETVIEPDFRDKQYWAEAWRFRDLLAFLAWRDIVVRYKQAILGIGWSLLRPLLNVLVYTVVFGIFAGLPAEGTPYLLFVLAALLPWQLFSNMVTDASNAVISNSSIVGKIYFPRIILPVSAALPSLVEFAIGFVLLFIMMVFFGVWPTWRLLLFPVFLIPVLALGIGLGILTSALYVRYRDMRFIVPFVLQIGFFMTPVAYSSLLVPEAYRWIYSLNPLVGALEGFRWATVATSASLDIFALGISAVAGLVAMVVGIFYFRRVEHDFADIV
jgi:lipopolysaccharide transport system permease protein